MSKMLFSTDTDSGTITVLSLIDGNLSRVSEINVGNGPRGGVKFTTSGKGYVANHSGNTVSEIDAHSLAETDRITVGLAPIGVAVVNDSYLLVSNGGDDTVSVVDLKTKKEVSKFPVGKEPRHPALSPDKMTAYIPIAGAHYVAKVDVSALHDEYDPDAQIQLTEGKRIDVGAGAFPYSVGVAPDGATAVVANNQAEHVTLISTADDTVQSVVEVGSKGARGVAFTPDSKTAFVSVENANEIAVIDIAKGSVTDRLQAGSGPRGILFDPGSATIFSAGFARGKASFVPALKGNAISVIRLRGDDSSAFSVKAQEEALSVPVGAGPCSVTMFEI